MRYLAERTGYLPARVMIITALFAVIFVHADEVDSPLKQLKQLLVIDPADTSELAFLSTNAQSLTAFAEQQEKARKAELKQRRQTIPLAEMSFAELKDYHHDPRGMISSRERRGLEELSRLAKEALQADSVEAHVFLVQQIREVQMAMQTNHRSPLPEKVGLLTFWSPLFKNLDRSIGKGTTPARNLSTNDVTETDLSRLEPKPSTFWRPPSHIAGQDLYVGFGRSKLPHFEKMIVTYQSPKTSFGMRPGFEVELDDVRYKVKFGEIHSEPFAARIFHVLGYHVDPTDYSSSVRLRYDRRLFREFHLRKPMTMRIQPFGIPNYIVQLQNRFAPFDFIAKVVMKDGRELSGAVFKAELLRDGSVDHPEDDPQNFRPEIEAQVDHLVTIPANIQLEDVPAKAIGPWEFEGLGHEDLRELRGAALLAAWLGWFDARFDNTRLRVLHLAKGSELQHFFTDLGSGLGGPHRVFSSHGEDPNYFAWSFTEPEIVRGPGRMTTPFRIINYQPNVQNIAFSKMTVDDARWMARWIAHLTELQLLAALIGAGYDAAEARLNLEMLVSRRDRMIRDLKLADEIPLLRPQGVDQELNYDPQTDGVLTFTHTSGKQITARMSKSIVRFGKLIKLVE